MCTVISTSYRVLIRTYVTSWNYSALKFSIFVQWLYQIHLVLSIYDVIVSKKSYHIIAHFKSKTGLVQLTIFLVLAWCQRHQVFNALLRSDVGLVFTTLWIFKVSCKNFDAHSLFVYLYRFVNKQIFFCLFVGCYSLTTAEH